MSTAPSRHGIRFGVAIARGAMGLGLLAAVVATYVDAASRGPVNPFDFFGYFTIQSNVLALATLLAYSALGFARRPAGRTLRIVRTIATTDMIITGIVYATLLAPLGAAGGAPVPWANQAMHIVGPLFVALDWFVLGGRRALSWREAAIVLIHPAIWVVVVLIRGATDGWVPYPFLNPSQGYGVVAVYCVIITSGFIVVGALVRGSSRWPSLLGTFERDA